MRNCFHAISLEEISAVASVFQSQIQGCFHPGQEPVSVSVCTERDSNAKKQHLLFMMLACCTSCPSVLQHPLRTAVIVLFGTPQLNIKHCSLRRSLCQSAAHLQYLHTYQINLTLGLSISRSASGLVLWKCEWCVVFKPFKTRRFVFARSPTQLYFEYFGLKKQLKTFKTDALASL